MTTKEQFNTTEDLLQAGIKDKEKVIEVFGKASELFYVEELKVSEAVMVALMLLAQGFEDLMPDGMSQTDKIRNAMNLIGVFMTKVNVKFKAPEDAPKDTN